MSGPPGTAPTVIRISPGRSSAIALARALNTAFFLATSVYCLLTYSPFTYEQFIKPNVSAALTNFAVWHGDLYWLALSITALTLAPYLEHPRARWLGWSYLAASVALGAWLFAHPLWLQGERPRLNLILAIVATLPPVWLAIFDHVSIERPSAFVLSNDARTWTSCWRTAAFAWVVYAVVAPVRLRLTGGIALPIGGILLGWTVSAVAHLTVFTLVFLVVLIIGGLAALTRSPGRTQYWLLWAASVAGVAVILLRVMLAPVAITGPAAWIVAVSAALALAAAWSGIARHRLAGRAVASVTALDAWLAPITATRARRTAVLGLVIGPLAVHLLIARVATFDWEFMLQKLAAIGLWLLAFGCIHALTRDRDARGPLWLAPLVVLALAGAEQVALPRLPNLVRDARLNPEFVLDGYAAVDPSFRIARDMLGAAASGDAAEFYAYLRANSTIERAGVGPVDITFVPPGTRSAGPRPHIFLFIIDSLRRDYLSPYNGAVGFTPAIRAFAGDSFVFSRAFSRYGGTGLSVPAIWAGSMLIHKQYVTPFAPMNALEKLLDANGYRRFITEDHISDALFAPSAATVGLDHNVPEMLHTFCRTMGELENDLRKAQDDPRPVFALTRPLDLHIGNIASATTPPGESYPGFYGPYAARVRRIDACFGEFIETLKRTPLYDNSIVVLTSDHGDSLGEGQRWGHGFTAFPEVMRIPLIIHVPAALRDRASADLTRLSFSTDITPTLYGLLGEPPVTDEPRGVRDLLMGAPLVVPPAADLSWRRRESYLVASSYGAVYGLLGHNGRRLYIADGIEGREYAFDLSPSGADARVTITDAERDTNRQMIRQQIGEIASWYRFTPGP